MVIMINVRLCHSHIAYEQGGERGRERESSETQRVDHPMVSGQLTSRRADPGMLLPTRSQFWNTPTKVPFSSVLPSAGLFNQGLPALPNKLPFPGGTFKWIALPLGIATVTGGLSLEVNKTLCSVESRHFKENENDTPN